LILQLSKQESKRAAVSYNSEREGRRTKGLIVLFLVLKRDPTLATSTATTAATATVAATVTTTKLVCE